MTNFKGKNQVRIYNKNIISPVFLCECQVSFSFNEALTYSNFCGKNIAAFRTFNLCHPGGCKILMASNNG